LNGEGKKAKGYQQLPRYKTMGPHFLKERESNTYFRQRVRTGHSQTSKTGPTKYNGRKNGERLRVYTEWFGGGF